MIVDALRSGKALPKSGSSPRAEVITKAGTEDHGLPALSMAQIKEFRDERGRPEEYYHQLFFEGQVRELANDVEPIANASRMRG
jgi:hypothetical protein